MDGPGDDPTRHFHGGNDRSIDAWLSQYPGDHEALRVQMYVMTARAGEDGLICDQLIVAFRHTGRRHQGISPRWTELKQLGWIVPNGKIRITSGGRAADVYVAVVPPPDRVPAITGPNDWPALWAMAEKPCYAVDG